MDLNSIYREHFLALLAAESAPSTRLRDSHRAAADRFWTMIERAKVHGTAPVPA